MGSHLALASGLILWWEPNGLGAQLPARRRGSLEIGKQADLVVLGGNPLTSPEDEIKDLPVDLTIVGGRIVHERKSGAPGESIGRHKGRPPVDLISPFQILSPQSDFVHGEL